MSKYDSVLIQAQVWMILMKMSSGYLALTYGLLLTAAVIRLLWLGWKEK